ncbi:hypothetical protein Q4489_04255 [Thalassotalea sp. 1_MG-2023]|uniref:hypothetical protein n=1 Tax=Thalassotalea sp. 1_MG-2023 TaxID=3062680 RepID=UPI0026E1EFD4|nr:hypothetical protein [Thalassotalea sp. 1_MG-2023]MDO6426209.1 hypothetical protein [Thalassotalea sp. 1_MG-2023]
MQNNTAQVIDKGRIVAAVDQYPEKQNGQVVMIHGTNQPKMKNKWMAIGEATKWKYPDGSTGTTEKIYLKPVNVNGAYFEQRTFWDSQNQQQPQQQGYQQPQQQGYQQPQQQSYQQAHSGVR